MKLLKTALATALVSGFLVSAQAATLVSWNTTSTFGLTNQANFGNLKVTAYSTTSVSNSGSRGATDSSSWLQAQIAGYGASGFGVRNGCAPSTNPCDGRDYSEGSTPEHAVDNEQVVDVVVFELPTIANMTWSFSALSIGYTSNDSSPEVNVWVGGSNLGQNYDFSQTCFVGPCSTAGDKSLSDPARGFTYAGRVDFNTGGNGTSGATINGSDFGGNNPNATGQYIVVAASSISGSMWDAFKISGIKATKTDVPPPPGTGQVPEPGSLMLLAGGLLGLACMRRRHTRV